MNNSQSESAFPIEVLQELKSRGEQKSKDWDDVPSNFIWNQTWLLTYCVENFIRIAGLSRLDRKPFALVETVKIIPIEVFGEPVNITFRVFPMRGITALFAFNDLNNPFYPKEYQA